MSSLFICSIAFITRPARPGSLSFSNRPSAVGMICHDRPNLSFNQPQRLGDPPSAVSFSQRSSISSWVSQATKNETASVNFTWGQRSGP